MHPSRPCSPWLCWRVRRRGEAACVSALPLGSPVPQPAMQPWWPHLLQRAFFPSHYLPRILKQILICQLVQNNSSLFTCSLESAVMHLLLASVTLHSPDSLRSSKLVSS